MHVVLVVGHIVLEHGFGSLQAIMQQGEVMHEELIDTHCSYLAICQHMHIVCINETSIPNCSVAPQNDVFNHAICTLSYPHNVL